MVAPGFKLWPSCFKTHTRHLYALLLYRGHAHLERTPDHLTSEVCLNSDIRVKLP